jgi:ATP-dependent protease HslVU (ClpYQ) peptidase subunit
MDKEKSMEHFYHGLIVFVALLGGLCTFIYWVFGLMEKRLEAKLESVGSDIHRIADELKEERRSKDYLYKFVIEHVKTDR